MAATARLSLADLEAISFGPPHPRCFWFHGHRLPVAILKRHGRADRRVCPECLADSPHHRAIWDLSLVSICPMHHRQLLQACLDCGRLLSWIGGDLTRCGKCLHGDLIRMPTPSVPEHETRATKVILGLLGDERFAGEASAGRRIAALADLAPAESVDFLFRIGLERMGDRRKIFSVEDPGEIAEQAHVALTRGLEVVERWPGAFFETLSEMRTRWDNLAVSSMRRCIGAVERWLDGLPDGHGLVIRQAVVDYQAQEPARLASAFDFGSKPKPRRKPRVDLSRR